MVNSISTREEQGGDVTYLWAERHKYMRMWRVADYRRISPGEGLVKEFLASNVTTWGDTLVDVGCGPGRAGRKLAEAGLRVRQVDIAPNALDPGNPLPFACAAAWDYHLPPADWVYCCDVLEHIPPAMVHQTLRNLRRMSLKGAFLQIATQPDSYGARIGESLHLSLETPAWWLAELQGLWRTSVNVQSEEAGLFRIFGTFLV